MPNRSTTKICNKLNEIAWEHVSNTLTDICTGAAALGAFDITIKGLIGIILCVSVPKNLPCEMMPDTKPDMVFTAFSALGAVTAYHVGEYYKKHSTNYQKRAEIEEQYQKGRQALEDKFHQDMSKLNQEYKKPQEEEHHIFRLSKRN